MANIYLHIGTHKTGTTAIQGYLDKNREALKKSGYLYPNTGHYINAPHQLAWVVKKCIPKWVKNALGEEVDKLDPSLLYKSLNNEIERSRLNNVIISSESYYIDTKTELLRSLLQQHSVKVIVYIRPQDEVLESLYLQALKDPHLRITMPVMEYYENRAYPYNYYDALQPWIDVFGKESVVVRPYNKERLFNHNLIDDFLNVCGIPELKGAVDLERNPNKRLDKSVMEFLRHIYKLNIQDEDLIQLVHDALLYNDEVESSSLFSELSLLSVNERKNIINKFKASNKKLANMFMEQEDVDYLTGESRVLNITPSSNENSLTVPDIVEVGVGVWKISKNRGKKN